MLHVTILVVGKTREAFIQEGLAFYQKRLQPFLHLALKSVREEKETAGLTVAAVKLREGERLRAQIPPRADAIALTPQGRQFSSEEFAAWLIKLELEARPHRRPSGAGPGDPGRFLRAPGPGPPHPTHELSRLVLLEQLYRAMTIKSGHPYHV